MKPTFDTIHPDVANALKACDIEEKDLFHYFSDLYIGCKNRTQANNIKSLGIWNASSSIFHPLRNSEMGSYKICLSIDFGYTGYYKEIERKSN